MTKFMINNRTDAWKTDVNLLNWCTWEVANHSLSNLQRAPTTANHESIVKWLLPYLSLQGAVDTCSSKTTPQRDRLPSTQTQSLRFSGSLAFGPWRMRQLSPRFPAFGPNPREEKRVLFGRRAWIVCAAQALDAVSKNEQGRSHDS